MVISCRAYGCIYTLRFLKEVLHLANGQCEQWTEDELISCIMQGTCYDCSTGCDCNSGYVRSIEGVCIPTNLCSISRIPDLRTNLVKKCFMKSRFPNAWNCRIPWQAKEDIWFPI
ncbi:unnamed protein product [Larinioides sclopetarius]|uniref:TIL domain-containing protein n=1 Tax=Larinioides sclopetarius TaxID=280406 RepID=A0AAV1ZTX9_9ARAC